MNPLGEVIAGPLRDQEGLLSATIDLDDIIRGRYDLDVVGHYARPDVFVQTVDVTPRAPVLFQTAREDSTPSRGDDAD